MHRGRAPSFIFTADYIWWLFDLQVCGTQWVHSVRGSEATPTLHPSMSSARWLPLQQFYPLITCFLLIVSFWNVMDIFLFNYHCVSNMLCGSAHSPPTLHRLSYLPLQCLLCPSRCLTFQKHSCLSFIVVYHQPDTENTLLWTDFPHEDFTGHEYTPWDWQNC